MLVARPPATEYPSFAAGYVSRILDDVEPIPALQRQRDDILRLLRAVSEEHSSYCYAPGKWSIKQCVGHMTDAERVFAYRMLRFARGDETPLPGFDENLFMQGAAFDDLGYADLVEGWRSVREATITLARTVAPDAWRRMGTASNQPASARGILYVTLGHTDHHRAVLVERYGLHS